MRCRRKGAWHAWYQPAMGARWAKAYWRRSSSAWIRGGRRSCAIRCCSKPRISGPGQTHSRAFSGSSVFPVTPGAENHALRHESQAAGEEDRHGGLGLSEGGEGQSETCRNDHSIQEWREPDELEGGWPTGGRRLLLRNASACQGMLELVPRHCGSQGGVAGIGGLSRGVKTLPGSSWTLCYDNTCVQRIASVAVICRIYFRASDRRPSS